MDNLLQAKQELELTHKSNVTRFEYKASSFFFERIT